MIEIDVSCVLLEARSLNAADLGGHGTQSGAWSWFGHHGLASATSVVGIISKLVVLHAYQGRYVGADTIIGPTVPTWVQLHCLVHSTSDSRWRYLVLEGGKGIVDHKELVATTASGTTRLDLSATPSRRTREASVLVRKLLQREVENLILELPNAALFVKWIDDAQRVAQWVAPYPIGSCPIGSMLIDRRPHGERVLAITGRPGPTD